MKIELFSTLRAVLRHGTFAAAADALNITPSAVSMQIKQLEAFFGRPMFDRSGPHPRPADFAFEVARTVGQTMDAIESLRCNSSLIVEGRLRFGIIETMQPVVLPGVVRWLRQHHPRLELQLTRGRTATLIAAVKSAEADVALVAQPAHAGAATLHWDPVLRQELVLIAPPGSPDVPLAELFETHEWIRYDRDTTSGAMAARFVHDNVGDIRAGMVLGSLSAIVAMVSAGLGISVLVVPDPAILSCYPVRVVRLSPRAPMLQFSLVSRKLDADSRQREAVLQAVRACLVSNF